MCQSTILTVLALVLWLGLGGGCFAYLGITTMVYALFQTKYQTLTLPRVGLALDEAAVARYFDEYLKECDNNPHLLEVSNQPTTQPTNQPARRTRACESERASELASGERREREEWSFCFFNARVDE